MEYTVNGKQFLYVYDYKDDRDMRCSFNSLTQKVYGFNFEQWYQDGYWKENYIPYSLLYKDVVVANASISIIDFNVFGEKKKFVQIGTVMTDPEFRNIGLSRFLIEKIIEIWHGKCDLMYLFANDSVLGFYTKFGFEKANEYQLTKVTDNAQSVLAAKKVDMSDSTVRESFIDMITKTKTFSDIAMENNIGLIMFYCTSFMKENVYYISKYNAYVVAEFDNETLYLHDVFCQADVELDKILSEITTAIVKKVAIGFTPTVKSEFIENLLKEDNTTLFVLGKDAELFRNNHLMFPILSRA